MAKVVVLGGGYSGLACVIELFKKAKDLELHLVDGQPEHYKITNLHKTFGQPVEKYSVPYAQLAEKFNFTFHQHHLSFSLQDLGRWQNQRKLPLQQSELPFDFLVVSTGAAPLQLSGGQKVLGQNDLRSGEGMGWMERLAEKCNDELQQLSVVGAGATGVQILFELHDKLRRRRFKHSLRLIDLNAQLLPELPKGFHRYIERKMGRSGIDYLPATKYLGQEEQQQIHLQEIATGKDYALTSDLTLLLPGVAATPQTLEANQFGQVVCEGKELPNILSAGDCSKFSSNGLNRLTAQAAIRKGKLVAHNIYNFYCGRSPKSYGYQEKGYLISLGATDAIGWLGLRANLVKGFPALVLKEAMETQYDLFLDGIDTYLGFP